MGINNIDMMEKYYEMLGKVVWWGKMERNKKGNMG